MKLLFVKLLFVKLLFVKLLFVKLLFVKLLFVKLLFVKLLFVKLLFVKLLFVKLLFVKLLFVKLLFVKLLFVKLLFVKLLKYTLIDTINQDSTGWEYLCVEMSHRTPHSQKYLLCNVYRKPGEIVDEMNAFLAEFSTFLQRVKNLNKLSYICGDYNIDLLKVKINPRFGEFFDHIISSGFFPKITLPTRFSDQSATLIDNVFSTNIEEKEVSGILLNHISDHQLLFTFIENMSYIEKVPKFINIQKTDPLSVDNFIIELREQNIYDRMHQPLDTNPNDNYEIFITHFQLAKNKHLPMKSVRYQKRKHKKSKWMTTGILNSINTKDRLYKTLLKTDTSSNAYGVAKANFKRYREILRNSIKRAKMLYYKKTFNLYQNDVKKNLGTYQRDFTTEKETGASYRVYLE